MTKATRFEYRYSERNDFGGYRSRISHARFDVRRVTGHPERREETQIEATVGSYRASDGKASTSQHMSVCIPPGEAIRLAAAIAPELAEVVQLLIRGDNLQAAIDAALKVIDHLPR